jgi:cytochrome c oxidase subunit 2
MPFKFIVVQKFKHSFFLELIWAGFPTIIVLLILAPSLYLLYSIDEELDPSVTVKVVGHQWF